jgi:hypothetical protein
MGAVSRPPTSTATLKPSRSVSVALCRLQELQQLSRVSCYIHFGTPEYSRCQKLRVSVLQKSADITKTFKWLDAVIIVLSEERSKRLIYLVSLTFFREEREDYTSCNTATVH